MKSKISISTLLRTPVKTVLTLILIIAVTFMLFSQTAEYGVTEREFNENVERYYGTGMVEAEPAVYVGAKMSFPYYIETDSRVNSSGIKEIKNWKYHSLPQSIVDEISSLTGVSAINKRYMTAGLSTDFYRREDSSALYDYSARVIIEGTLDEIKYSNRGIMTWKFQNVFCLKDVKILAGQADINKLQVSDNRVYVDANVTEIFNSYIPNVKEEYDNNCYFCVENGTSKCIGIITSFYNYGREFQNNLKIGNRYTLVLRFSRNESEIQNRTLFLYDWLTEPWCKAVWDITDAPENYLELEEYEPLRELIDLTNKDIHTLDVVYADDMSAIKKISENSMQIEQGCWLTPEDTENDNKVCVINNKFAEDNNLKLGDTISLKLGHELFEQFYSLGAVAGTKERLSEEWTDAEFEIVGIYKDRHSSILSLNPNWTYSSNTVFVPLSSLPLTEEELEGHEFSPAEFTFRIDNAWDIEAFKEECIPQIEAMGLTVMFDDGGWSEVVKAFTSAQRLAIIRIALLSAVTVIATGFVVYLFISRKRKDYAIMRALGTTKGKAERTLLLPLMVLTAVGVAVGTAIGWIYTANTIAGSSSLEILGDYAVNTSIPLWPVIVCAAGEIALTFIFALFMLKKMGRRSPLELLQGKK